jgi:hypothetical protein
MDMTDGLGVINFRGSDGISELCIVVVWIDSIFGGIDTVPVVDGSGGTESNNGSKLTRRRLKEVWLDPDESGACRSADEEELEEQSVVSFSRLTCRCFLGLTLSFIIASVIIF